MTIRQAAVTGGVIGLLISVAVLTLMWFGTSGVLWVGGTDFMYVLWPSAFILVIGWRTTAVGICITIYSVLTNCAMYAGIAVLTRACVRWLSRAVRSRSGSSSRA